MGGIFRNGSPRKQRSIEAICRNLLAAKGLLLCDFFVRHPVVDSRIFPLANPPMARYVCRPTFGLRV
jgi:hypothetical protein